MGSLGASAGRLTGGVGDPLAGRGRYASTAAGPSGPVPARVAQSEERFTRNE